MSKRKSHNNEWYEEFEGTEDTEFDPDYCYECDSFRCECYELLDDDYNQRGRQQNLFDGLFDSYQSDDYNQDYGYDEDDEYDEQPDNDYSQVVEYQRRPLSQPLWSQNSFRRYSIKPLNRVDPNERVLYFAFGSNMEKSQMLKRCPSAQEVEGKYTLDGYRLTFCGHSNKWGGGVATIIKERFDIVLGRLFSLTWSDVYKLDGFEGHPYVYKRQYVTLTDGQRVLTYIKPVKNNESRPSHSYFTTIARGYQQVGYELDKLVDSSIK